VMEHFLEGMRGPERRLESVPGQLSPVYLPFRYGRSTSINGRARDAAGTEQTCQELPCLDPLRQRLRHLMKAIDEQPCNWAQRTIL
jgi:hypothetical protein